MIPNLQVAIWIIVSFAPVFGSLSQNKDGRRWSNGPLEPAHAAMEKGIHEKLDKEIKLQESATPIKDVLAEISCKYQIPIRLAEDELAEAQIDLGKPICIQLEYAKVRTALKRLLGRIHLTCSIHNGTLVIEPRQRNGLCKKEFPIEDLMHEKVLKTLCMQGEGPAKCSDLTSDQQIDQTAQLFQVLVQQIEPKTWSSAGGAGTVEFDVLTKSMVVHQVPDVLDQIAERLKELRRKGETEDDPPAPLGLHETEADGNEPLGAREEAPQKRIPKPCSRCLISAAVDHEGFRPLDNSLGEIDRQLECPVNIMIGDTSLNRALARLECALHINISIDEDALDQDGVDLEKAVSLELEGIKLKSVLKLLLDKAHLAYRIKPGVVEITTRSKAERHAEYISRVYVIDDLCDSTNLSENQSIHRYFHPTDGIIDSEFIASLVSNTIDPETWDNAGGHGWIYTEPMANILVVFQLPENQKKVQELLDNIRALSKTIADKDSE